MVGLRRCDGGSRRGGARETGSECGREGYRKGVYESREVDGGTVDGGTVV